MVKLTTMDLQEMLKLTMHSQLVWMTSFEE